MHVARAYYYDLSQRLKPLWDSEVVLTPDSAWSSCVVFVFIGSSFSKYFRQVDK